MESPVRICLSAAIVVHLLLLSNSNVQSSTIPPSTPPESKATTLHVHRKTPGYMRVNSTTWVPRRTTEKSTEDLLLNDINQKETESQESVLTKDEKSKSRGTVRYSTQKYKPSTPMSRRRTTSSTKKPELEIVTPTPEKMSITQIIDSMRKYKSTKIPMLSSSSSTTPTVPERQNDPSNEESYTNGDEEHDYDVSKFTSSEFHDDDHVYSFPGSDDQYSYSSNQKETRTYKDFSKSPFEDYSSGKLKEPTYGPNHQPYKPYTGDSFDNFFENLELTTPKNDFFDKKFKEVSQSIVHNLEKHKARTTKPEKSHRENVHGVDVTKSLNLEQFMNTKPSNNSELYIHKSKSILVTDNDQEGSSLSDVQGTSIYYETSLMSTESYGTDTVTEGDCDNETRTDEPTPSTPPEREEKRPLQRATEPTVSSTDESVLTSVGTNYPNRNGRITPKRINLSASQDKDITKDDTFTQKSDEISSNNLVKPTRRIQYTTPKTRVSYRISVKKNPSTAYITRPSKPTTIYAEHFNIKDKQQNAVPERKQNLLTTVSSAIDPLYETEISGTKKVVHSHTISDNTIPSLRKRGSTRFTGSTTELSTSSEEDSWSFMAIPTASSSWGTLAGMRNPPSPTSPMVNVSAPVTKNPDENELQRVTESEGNNPSSTSSTTTTTTTISNTINIDLTPNKSNYSDEHWRPVYVSPQENYTTRTPSQSEKMVEIITAKPLESPPTTVLTNELTGETKDASPTSSDGLSFTSGWVPVNKTDFTKTQPTAQTEPSAETQYSVSLTVSSSRGGLASTTKLASNTTTPQVDIDSTTESAGTTGEDRSESMVASSSVISTQEKDIPETTTLTYIPISTIATESDLTTTIIEETSTVSSMNTVTPEMWHPVLPARKTSLVTKFVNDVPITTYRPMFTITDPNETETEKETESQTFTTPENQPMPTTVSTEVDMTTIKVIEDPTTIRDKVSEIAREVSSETVRRETTTAETVPVTVEIETTPQVSTTEELTTPKMEETTVFTVTEKRLTPSSTESLSEYSKETTTSENTISVSKEGEVTTEGKVVTDKTEVDTTTYVKTVEEGTTPAVIDETTEEGTTVRAVSKLEDLTRTYSDDLTTHAPYDQSTEGQGAEEPSTAAGVAIAVSTIGVIALLLLIGLLLVLRRRRRRGRPCGVFAQRCTPVTLDDYNLDSVSVARRKGTQRLRASKRSYGNPAYDDEVVISHPMQYAALANFALDCESMAAEFSEIPAGSVRADEVPPGCEDKNRYSNVLPLPETRVPLQRLDNDPTSEYINANYVTGPGNIKNYYIACQAPMSTTVADFWRMVWEQNSRVIVMLTEYMENGVEKCFEYLPPSEVTDNKRTFGDFQVILKRREHREKYAVSSVQLKNLNTKTWREVSHLWYFWPAKGVPDDYDSIINFMSEMRNHMKLSQNAKEFDEDDTVVENGSASNLAKLKTGGGGGGSPGSGKGVNVYSPQKAEEMMRKTNGTNNGTLGRMKAAAELEGVRACVVTCASGAGRTGALLALDVCARALEGSGTVDVPRTVRALRSARPHALQNKNQYIFLYKTLCEELPPCKEDIAFVYLIERQNKTNPIMSMKRKHELIDATTDPVVAPFV